MNGETAGERCGDCMACQEWFLTPDQAPPCSRWRLRRKHAMIAVLRSVAKKRCNKKNCGTVCKCEPCMARLAIERYDPEWRP